MSALRKTYETLTCAWCGAIEDVGGKQSPVASSAGIRIPEGWHHVYANLDPDTSDESIFVTGDDDGTELHFVCSARCEAASCEAVQLASGAYVGAWDSLCPRRKKVSTTEGTRPPE